MYRIRKEIQKKIKSFGIQKYHFEPLEIIFNIGSPTMLTYPWIAFDGIIAHLQTQNILGEVFDMLPPRNPMDFVKEMPMPIKREKFINNEGNADYFFHASVSIFQEQTAISTTTIYKKFDEVHALTHLITKKKRIENNKGKFKSYAMQMPLNYSKQCSFFVNGDKDTLSCLCKNLSFLGKKRAIGYGEIINFKINNTKKDLSLFQNNKTMRSIPVDYFDKQNLNYKSKDLAILSYKPPYWDKSNMKLCVAPEVIY